MVRRKNNFRFSIDCIDYHELYVYTFLRRSRWSHYSIGNSDRSADFDIKHSHHQSLSFKLFVRWIFNYLMERSGAMYCFCSSRIYSMVWIKAK
jgi:hypothetical protein